MITIVLLVSRKDFLSRVISAIELLDCNREAVDILAIVDGDNELYVETRNMIQDTKYNNRLTVKLDAPGDMIQFDIKTRRKRIAAGHNQAGQLISNRHGYVFSVEDDTIVPPKALKRLQHIADTNSAMGFAEGVELGRWGVPYVGAWHADDLYETTQLISTENVFPVQEDTKPTRIDAGGLYCSLMKADLYKDHTFTSDNGLGPDVNFGLWARRMGYEGFIEWKVPCKHLTNNMGIEKEIVPSDDSRQVVLEKTKQGLWKNKPLTKSA